MPLSKALTGPGRLNKWVGHQCRWSRLSEERVEFRGGWRDREGSRSRATLWVTRMITRNYYSLRICKPTVPIYC